MKTKRIKLRGWVLVVLKTLLIIDMLFMSLESDSLKVMLIKTIITILISLPILYLLVNYGGINEK